MGICFSCDTDTYPSHCNSSYCNSSYSYYNDQNGCIEIITPDSTLNEYNNTPTETIPAPYLPYKSYSPYELPPYNPNSN